MDKKEYLKFAPLLTDYNRLLRDLKKIVVARALADYNLQQNYIYENNGQWHVNECWGDVDSFYFNVGRYGYDDDLDYSLSIHEAFDGRDEYVLETENIIKQVQANMAAKRNRLKDDKKQQDIDVLKRLLNKYPEYRN